MFSGNGNSKVSPTDGRTDGRTWVGARDACASKKAQGKPPEKGFIWHKVPNVGGWGGVVVPNFYITVPMAYLTIEMHCIRLKSFCRKGKISKSII